MKDRRLILLLFAILLFVIILVIAIFSSLKTNNLIVPGNNSDGNSGISGNISLGPITPVCREGTPCYIHYVGDMIVKENDIEITRFLTDKNGSFNISLNPGTYFLQVDRQFIAICGKEVIVKQNQFSSVDINCDTGIR